MFAQKAVFTLHSLSSSASLREPKKTKSKASRKDAKEQREVVFL
jgi:hypothetical protein